MIQPTEQNATSLPRKAQAIGLLSGGLDSTVAAKVVIDLGVDVQGVYFAMPWGCCDKQRAQAAADFLGIPLMVLQLDERYLEMVRNPKYGYGTAMNPCVDCRSHMFSRAAQHMKAVGADFLFTGEVLGQRPMSQLRHSMKWIEKETGIEGRLLRPLCAQLMDPTIPEQEGLIDRERLLRISGRSRREQMAMAAKFHFKDYPAPAGGCLLTDHNFANRMKDIFKHGYRNFRETIALKWGRHFRINEHFKAIVGREDIENDILLQYAHENDHIFQMLDRAGPTLILKGDNPSDDILSLAAGLVQKFSKDKHNAPVEVSCWPVKDKNIIRKIKARVPDDRETEQMKI